MGDDYDDDRIDGRELDELAEPGSDERLSDDAQQRIDATQHAGSSAPATDAS